MVILIKPEEEEAKYNKIAVFRKERGLAVDPIYYSGKKGQYTMSYDGERYVPGFLLKDCSLLSGFDSHALEKILIKL